MQEIRSDSKKRGRAHRYSERDLLRETGTGTPWSGILPREEGQDCAGVADLVSVVEMISAGVIEVDCLFDKALAMIFATRLASTDL